VDVLPVDLGRKLRERIQARLVPAPVIGRSPVFGQLPEIAGWDASAPADIRQLAGPARARQPVAQIVDVGLGYAYLEWADVHTLLSFQQLALVSEATHP
jgi:hypothetical protein